MARIAQDDDVLIVNRAGVDFSATVAEVRPPVCQLDELPPPPPFRSDDSSGENR